MSEALSPQASEQATREYREDVGERSDRTESERGGHDRTVSIVEAILLSLVALLAAWSGYSAAKWGTQGSLSLAKASAARSRSSFDEIQATQIRTLDSVSFNAAETAYAAGNEKLFALALRRLRPGYRPAVYAWLALHPLRNPKAPPDPSYMPQYRIPQEAEGRSLSAQSIAYFTAGASAAATSDKYVRLTVLFAAVLFLVGISSRFPVRAARDVLVGIAIVLLVLSVVQLLGLPGPPS